PTAGPSSRSPLSRRSRSRSRRRRKKTGVSSPPTVGVLLSRVRVEEKMLLEDLDRRHVPYRTIDDQELVLEVEKKPALGVDVVLERCIQHSRALYALSVLNTWGIPTVNTFEV